MRNARARTALTAVFGALLIGLLAVPQAQASAGTAGRPAAMTQKDARAYIARDMKQSTGKYWAFGDHKKIFKCRSLSSLRVRCKIEWYYRDKFFIHGSGTAFYKANDPVHVFTRHDLHVDRV